MITRSVQNLLPEAHFYELIEDIVNIALFYHTSKRNLEVGYWIFFLVVFTHGHFNTATLYFIKVRNRSSKRLIKTTKKVNIKVGNKSRAAAIMGIWPLLHIVPLKAGRQDREQITVIWRSET